jgi:hypothetical protein
MAFQDWFIAQDRTSSKPDKKLALDDVEQLIRIGEITGQMPLVFSQLSKQLLNSSQPRRRASVILMYPMILIGVFVLSAVVVPRMLEQQGARVGKAKAADAKTAQTDDSRLVLNATCIMGEERLAIINGRTYRPKDTLVGPNPAAPPCVITEILPHKVLLECQGKRLQLCYADGVTESQGMSPTARSIQTETLPPELTPGAEGEGLNLLLDKVQRGDVGLGDVLPILSTLSSKKKE